MLINEFPEQAARMYNHGRRNVSWNTVAPTGSVSILTQTTSGLEPLFAPYYMRRKKVNPGEEGVRVDFTDQNGDNWMEYPIMHPQFIEWYHKHLHSKGYEAVAFYPEVSDAKECLESLDKETLDIVFKDSPWYNSCANRS